MIWLTWRQHRRQALFAVVGLAVLAVLMMPTGQQMHRAIVDTGLADCLDKLGRSEYIPLSGGTEGCHSQMNRFEARYGTYASLGTLFVFLPLVVGLFSAPRWWPARSSRAPIGWSGPRA